MIAQIILLQLKMLMFQTIPSKLITIQLGRTQIRQTRPELQQGHKRRQRRRSLQHSSLLLWRMLRSEVGCNNLLQSSSAILYCLYNKRKSGWDLRVTQGALLEPWMQRLTYVTEGQKTSWTHLSKNFHQMETTLHFFLKANVLIPLPTS